MKKFLVLLSSLFFTFTGIAVAQNSISQQCIQTQFSGIICPPPNGTIVSTQFSGYVCGRGQCVATNFQGILCAATPGGHAIQTQFQGVQCVGGCEQASPSYCVRPNN
jgi:hypothetical protein